MTWRATYARRTPYQYNTGPGPTAPPDSARTRLAFTSLPIADVVVFV